LVPQFKFIVGVLLAWNDVKLKIISAQQNENKRFSLHGKLGAANFTTAKML